MQVGSPELVKILLVVRSKGFEAHPKQSVLLKSNDCFKNRITKNVLETSLSSSNTAFETGFLFHVLCVKVT